VFSAKIVSFSIANMGIIKSEASGDFTFEGEAIVTVAIVGIDRNSVSLFRKGHHKRLGVIIQPLPHL